MAREINILQEILKLEENFQENKVVTGKTPFFVIAHFVLSILLVSTLASGLAVLHGKD